MKAVLPFLAAFFFQAQAATDTAMENSKGFKFSKPPKNGEEWEIKNENGSLSISHKVSAAAAVVVHFATVVNASNFNTKTAAEENWKAISTSGKYKDLKKKGVWPARLPGNAANGASTHRLDVTFTSEDGQPMTWKVYHFNNNASEHFYMLSVIADAVSAAKYAKELHSVLASIRLFKPPK